MVLTVSELEKSSYRRNFYRYDLNINNGLMHTAPNCSKECLVPEFVEEGIMPDLGEQEDVDFKHASDLLMRVLDSERRHVPIFELRRELLRRHRSPTRKGLMPYVREFYDDPIPETFLYMDPRPDEGQVGVAGFDLRVGNFIAWSDELIRWGDRAFIPELEINGYKRDNYKYLEPGEEFVLKHDPSGNRFYYITSHEGILHSDNLEIAVDSKSTTGRVGAFTHAGGFTDEGKFVIILQPHAFDLKVTSGKTRLSQVAVRYSGSPYMTREEILSCLEVGFDGKDVTLEDSLGPRGLQMKFDTRIAYRALKCDEPIDMDAVGTIDPKKYFELIEGDHELAADRETLYLLGSLGIINLGNVCGILSKQEGVASGIGTYSNFAGIFQPGYRGGITMEYYSHSKQRIPRGENAGLVLFDKVQGEIDRKKSYCGSYQDQRPPTLPKMFRQD